MNTTTNYTDLSKANYKHFDLDGPNFTQSLEGFELQNGTQLYAAVQYGYNRSMGLYAEKVLWLNSTGQEINLAHLPYQDTKWLHADLEKCVKMHATCYFEQAFNYFEL